ncbi:hypothetical protein ACFPRL_12790 [Pseudoclavibacter helvolus]
MRSESERGDERDRAERACGAHEVDTSIRPFSRFCVRGKTEPQELGAAALSTRTPSPHPRTGHHHWKGQNCPRGAPEAASSATVGAAT